ncbi:hypothetical protein Leryth_023054 [Lithospermum erythrorhizon]|nr:hypothetical protein Leryth_023054 [Lithospermum erythrorhizon]
MGILVVKIVTPPLKPLTNLEVRNSSFYFQLEREVLASILPLQMLLFCMIVTGIRRLIYKLRIVLIELVRRRKFKFFAFAVSTLLRKRLLRGHIRSLHLMLWLFSKEDWQSRRLLTRTSCFKW